MTEAEQRTYERIVDSLRKKGWSRMEAEGEALERIDKARQKEKEEACKHNWYSVPGHGAANAVLYRCEFCDEEEERDRS